jgi:hypothetical protein
MATDNSTRIISITDKQHDRIALELIRTNDLISLAVNRSANGDDSKTLTLLAAIQDRVRSVEQCLGLSSECEEDEEVSHG